MTAALAIYVRGKHGMVPSGDYIIFNFSMRATRLNPAITSNWSRLANIPVVIRPCPRLVLDWSQFPNESAARVRAPPTFVEIAPILPFDRSTISYRDCQSERGSSTKGSLFAETFDLAVAQSAPCFLFVGWRSDVFYVIFRAKFDTITRPILSQDVRQTTISTTSIAVAAKYLLRLGLYRITNIFVHPWLFFTMETIVIIILMLLLHRG